MNGIHNEDLLLIVLTRLKQFQESEYKCRENALAITKIEEALMWLGARTKDREAKGIEGTSKIFFEDINQIRANYGESIFEKLEGIVVEARKNRDPSEINELINEVAEKLGRDE